MDDYQLPDFAMGEWLVSKETADHMNRIAEQQQKAHVKADFVFGDISRPSSTEGKTDDN